MSHSAESSFREHKPSMSSRHKIDSSGARSFNLAVTGLRSTWSSAGPDVFLGAWCFEDREEAGRTSNAAVAPYPWRDPGLRTEGLRNCMQISLSAARQLAPFFSELSAERFDTRDMELLAAGAIGRIVMAAYHNFVCLKEAASRYPALRMVGIRSEDYVPPSTMTALLEQLRLDEVQLQIVSDLAPAVGIDVDRRFRRDLSIPSVLTAAEKLRRLQGERRGLGKASSAVAKYASRLQAGFAECVLYNTCFSRLESASLALKSGFRVATLPLVNLDHLVWPDPSLDLRSKLERALVEILGDGQFERPLCKILARMLPVSILEGLTLLGSVVAKNYPRRPKSIVSAMGWNNDDSFRLWCIQSRRLGSRLVGCQHGGAYGKRYLPGVAEHMEYLVVDRFVSWGGSGKQAKSQVTLPVPPSQLTTPAKKPNDTILYVGTSVERWTSSIAHYPMGPMFFDYFDRQIEFCQALPPNLRSKLLVRANPADVGWSEACLLRRHLPAVQLDDFQRPFLDRLRSARIAVVDNLNTTFLQCLGSGIPTILVWDPDVWTVKEPVWKYFERLETAGVYFRTPKAAAMALQRVWEADPKEWWGSSSTSSAVQEFLDAFLMRDPNWMPSWIRELLQTSAECAA